MNLDALIWVLLPVFVAAGSALLSYYIMQARMEVAIAKERESLAEANALINSNKVTLEERIVRHRCVEAWAMVVPWTGFPLKDLVALAKPNSNAKYIRFETFNKPDIASGQRPGLTYGLHFASRAKAVATPAG